MQVISLSALTPQSGKDTLADHIASTDGLRIERVSFASKLRREVASLFASTSVFHSLELLAMLRCSAKDIEHPEFAITKLPLNTMEQHSGSYRWFMANMVNNDPIEMTKPRSLRFHMQHYGNNYIREFQNKPFYWINYVRHDLNMLRNSGADVVIVTDCRDPLEFTMLTEEYNATTILIKKDGFPKSIHDTGESHNIEKFAHKFNYDFELDNIYGDPSCMALSFDELELFSTPTIESN